MALQLASCVRSLVVNNVQVAFAPELFGAAVCESLTGLSSLEILAGPWEPELHQAGGQLGEAPLQWQDDIFAPMRAVLHGTKS